MADTNDPTDGTTLETQIGTLKTTQIVFPDFITARDAEIAEREAAA